MKIVPIWEPKYKDNTALISTKKLGEKQTYIFFCMDKEYKNLYSFDSERAKKEAPIVSNSKILCYAIPLKWLKEERELNPKEILIKEKEIEKYRKKVIG